MSLQDVVTEPIACNICKKQKKACDKAVPSCARCSRLSLKCTYSNPMDPEQLVLGLLTLGSVNPAGSSYFPSYHSPGFYDQVTHQILELLRAISRQGGDIEDLCITYFSTTHRDLPVIHEDDFYHRLRSQSFSPQFSVLLLSVIVMAHLSSTIRSETGKRRGDLYRSAKSAHFFLQSTGEVSVEAIQSGLLIASYEYCQGLIQDAWLSIGACCRMGHVLGLHEIPKTGIPPENVAKADYETRRRLWWGIVVLERVIALEHGDGTLPCASQAPELDDILFTASGDSRDFRLVSEDLVLPNTIDIGEHELSSRQFTKLGPFESSIQASYLLEVVNTHIKSATRDPSEIVTGARNLDLALQAFLCSLLAPPEDRYCRHSGAFGIRVSAAFALYTYMLPFEAKAGEWDCKFPATFALQSLIRIIIQSARVSVRKTAKCIDGMAFWAHGAYAKAALAHISYGSRDEHWASDLEILKAHLRFFEPRYGLYDKYLREIERAENIYPAAEDFTGGNCPPFGGLDTGAGSDTGDATLSNAE